jgi:trigger factor
MKSTIKSLSDTQIKLTVIADEKDLGHIKKHIVEKLAPQVKMPGFREGKVPLHLAEKQLDPNFLQGEILDDAINHLYFDAINQNKVRAVANPKIELSKFVPYTMLEFTAVVDVLGQVKLPDYKKVTAKMPETKVVEADIKEVLTRLQQQAAEYKEVDRPAKKGDRVWVEFEGKDDKGAPIKGAKGNNYPLNLGSNTFIPGFEDNLLGLKKDAKKTFDIKFPKDYQVKTLAGTNAIFDIKVLKVEEVKISEINDDFAKKLGKFANVNELKADIKKQLNLEKEHQARLKFEDEIVKSIVAKTKVNLPDSLLQEQMGSLDQDFKRNLNTRGQTFEDYLAASGLNEDEYKQKELKPIAEERLKAGLVLSEIAEAENITVGAEEIEIRLQILKNQYKDPSMAVELDKPEAKREIASRLLTEKTITKLVSYASGN